MDYYFQCHMILAGLYEAILGLSSYRLANLQVPEEDAANLAVSCCKASPFTAPSLNNPFGMFASVSAYFNIFFNPVMRLSHNAVCSFVEYGSFFNSKNVKSGLLFNTAIRQ